jgi:tyrosinase
MTRQNKNHVCLYGDVISMEKDIIVRKNVKSLSPTEKKNFIDAVKALKANTKDKRIGDNRYDDYVLWHAQTMMIPAGSDDTTRNLAHRGSVFLPWHREFLRRFELDLRKEISGVTLPYWDWAADASLRSNDPDIPPWTKSPIWQEDFMGGNGNPSFGNTVMDGPFKDWVTQEVDDMGNPWRKGKLKRDFGSGIRTLPTQIDVYNVFSFEFYDTPYWNVFSKGFRNALEGFGNGTQLHNRVHVWVGGSMELSSSPNDPVFFLNHCNVDRIWALWQDLRFNRDYPDDGAIVDRNCKKIDGYNLSDPMVPWKNDPESKTIEDVLVYRKLNYIYEK